MTAYSFSLEANKANVVTLPSLPAGVTSVRFFVRTSQGRIGKEVPGVVTVVAGAPVLTFTKAQLSLFPTSYALRMDNGRTVFDGTVGLKKAVSTVSISSSTPPAPSVIIFGDSVTAQNGTGPDSVGLTSASMLSGRGYWVWASQFMGQRLKFVRNAGISGNTTAQMLARIDADVLAYPSGWVVVAGGINDISNGVDPATTISNLTTIITKLKDDNRRVILMTPLPSIYYDTTTKKDAWSKIYKWTLDTAPTLFPGVVTVDTARPLINLATGAPLTGLTIDGVHPSDLGAQRMGKAIADALSLVIPPKPPYFRHGIEPGTVLANPLASSTGWTTFAGAGTATATYPVAENRGGVKAVVTMTGTNGDVGIQHEAPSSTGLWAPGDTVQAVARVRWTNVTPVASTKSLWPQVRITPRNSTAAGSGFTGPVFSSLTSSSEQQVLVEPMLKSGEVTLLTPKITTQPNNDRLYIGVLFSGASDGVFEVLDISAYKV